MSLFGVKDCENLFVAIHKKSVSCSWTEEREESERRSAYSELRSLQNQLLDGSISSDEYHSSFQLLLDRYFVVQHTVRRKRLCIDWQSLFTRLFPLLLLLCFFLAIAAALILSGLLSSALHISETSAEIISISIVIALTACIIALYYRVKRHGGANLSYIFSGREHKEKCRFLCACARNTILAACPNNASFCEKLFLPVLSQIVQNDKKTVSTLRTNSDYEKCVLNILFTLSFRKAISGEYHFYYGQLDFNGQEIKNLCLYCLSRGKELGMISDELYEEQRNALISGIKSVG